MLIEFETKLKKEETVNRKIVILKTELKNMNMRNKTNKKQLFSKILCCIILSIPLIGNCQTDINEPIYMETFPGGDTVRFYYDESDNKILHGKQVNIDFYVKKECNYKHGVLDGEYIKTWNYDYGVRRKIIGFYKNGVVDSIWSDYRYSEKTNQLELFHWEEWNNEKLLRLYNNKADIHLHPIDNINSSSAQIYNGVVALEYILLEINEDGIVTNAFLRQNGDIEKFNEEMQTLMDTYLETKNDSIFLKTNFRITTVFADSRTIYDYDSYLHKGKENYIGNPIGCPDIKVKILKRIKYTPVEEIIESLNEIKRRYSANDMRNTISSIRENLCFYLGGNTFSSGPFYWHTYCHINPNDIDTIENYIQNLEEKERRKKEVSNLLNTLKNLELERHIIRQYINENTYENIRSTMVKKSYKNITEKDIELLREFIGFVEDIKSTFVDKKVSVTFNNNDKKIKNLAYKNCDDILPIYEKEVNNPVRTFNTISEFYKLVNEYEAAIKKQEDFINYLNKRETIKNKDNSFYQNATNYKHLVKTYEEYKQSFNLSWSNNGDWVNRLNEFECSQNEYIRCCNLLEKINDNDIIIIEASKEFKRIKKAYSEYKKSLNFENIPHVDKNKSLVEFVEFQTKVLNNIKSKGEEINDSLKKVKKLNDKKEVLTK